ncbi:DNA-directed RNA polymerases I and III subunit rpac1 [Porphyridium purpureum]|uniref:DNA-directed RNA polymerases I and III subunit RPAC1 n=1 Tax=Porphyridium purpureum TaxID=35688 RepID=A0A5J4YV70_PORPP|nr:DNA-directed RNA polymerases I and III subunit rpac1 [Porphyridium purpureum]|eukprot:POR4792..scf227_4
MENGPSAAPGRRELPEHLERTRRHIEIGATRPSNVEARHAHDAYAALGVTNALDLAAFERELRVVVRSNTHDELVFEMQGIDAPLANAFRRIMLAETPTMAVEHATFVDNTSIIHDEILAHRLGLIPIMADPREFDYHSPGEPFSEHNSIKMVLDVECKVRADAVPDAPASQRFENASVYSRQIEWIPIGAQGDRYADNPIRPVHDDILIAQLVPGQRIHVEMVCIKGTGHMHAKWSPVATAYYQLMPVVEIRADSGSRIVGAHAQQLQKLCPGNVFDIESVPGSGLAVATVARPQSCTMCRECIRDKPWADQIRLSRVRNHFIFSIESTGALPAYQIFLQALEIMVAKCTEVKKKLEAASRGLPSSSSAAARTAQGASRTGTASASIGAPLSTIDEDDDLTNPNRS